VFEGKVQPAVPTQRRLADVLGVPVAEMLVRSGLLTAYELVAGPSNEAVEKAAPLPPVDLRAYARSSGVDEDRIELFVQTVESVVSAFRTPPAG
jgi:hypothetical protein